jgi:DNA-binding NarL/FixJ family response regulator
MGGSQHIAAIIADDHPVFLKGLRRILDQVPDLTVVGEANDGTAAWQLIQDRRPTLAILDLEMPGLDGLQIARRVHVEQVAVRLVILTMHKDGDLFRQALEAGVLGYLLKEDLMADLMQCLSTVTDGHLFIAPALAANLAESPVATGVSATPLLSELSATQREVLKLIAQGRTTSEMGMELGISAKTVENHRLRIVDRLGLQGNNGLLRFALENKDKLQGRAG